MIAIWALATSHSFAPDHQTPLYLQPRAPIASRVADLIGRMTIQEKVNQLLGDGWPNIDRVKKDFSATGVGSIGFGVPTITRLEALNDFQRSMMNTSRLGIPVAFTAETLHSGQLPQQPHHASTFVVCALADPTPPTLNPPMPHPGGHSGCTVFPMPAGQGSSWNKTLVRLIAESNALQARASGTVHGLAPVLNVATDPRFGRTQECFGEDPVLVATMGVAAVTGLQGSDGPRDADSYFGSPQTHVMSQAKHFGACAAPRLEPTRAPREHRCDGALSRPPSSPGSVDAYGGADGYSADISERTLYERYFLPWLRFASAGGRGAMASHNTINYEPVHGSYRWMTSVLRHQLGFGDGFIGADSHNVLALQTSQHVAASVEDAAVLAVEAGLDQDLNSLYDTPFTTLATSSVVNKSAIDRAAANVLRYKVALGLFEQPFANLSLFPERNSASAQRLAREAAAQSMVLLKNDGALPLKPPQRVLVLGRLANDSATLLGDYAPQPDNDTMPVSIYDALRASPELSGASFRRV